MYQSYIQSVYRRYRIVRGYPILSTEAMAVSGHPGLNFIRDSEKILVLNTGGTVNSFDTPAALLGASCTCRGEDGAPARANECRCRAFFAQQLAEENKRVSADEVHEA